MTKWCDLLPGDMIVYKAPRLLTFKLLLKQDAERRTLFCPETGSIVTCGRSFSTDEVLGEVLRA